MRPRLNQSGQRAMALIGVVFIMVIMAGAVLMMSQLVTLQNATNVLSMEAVRAEMASYSGLEWLLYQLGGGADCTGSPFVWSLTEGDLNGFTVTLSCTETLHAEAGSTVVLYDVQSAASKGVLGTSEYVYRELTTVVEF